jgi:hypothetical protein
VVQPLRGTEGMRVPPSAKLVVATWIAALIGALAGRSAAEAYGAPLGTHDASTTVATRAHVEEPSSPRP